MAISPSQQQPSRVRESPSMQSGWTVDTLMVHFEEIIAQIEVRLQQRFDAQEKSVTTAMVAAEKAVNAALLASEKAVEKAERAQELRNHVANEFRATLEDSNKRMWPIQEGRATVQQVQGQLENDMASVRRELESKIAVNTERLTSMNNELFESRGGRTAMHAGYEDSRERQSDQRAVIALMISLMGVGVVVFRALTGH